MLACLRSWSDARMFPHVSLWPNVEGGFVHVWSKRSRSDAGMFWHVLLWPNVGRALVHVWYKRSGSDAGMFSHVSLWPSVGRGFVHVWKKTLWKWCWHVYVLEAMLACFRMFRFGLTWEEALCMFDKNGLEAMLACFWRSCIHVLHFPGQVPFWSCMVVESVDARQAWLSSEFVVAVAHLDSQVALRVPFSSSYIHVFYYCGQVLFSFFMVVAPVAVGLWPMAFIWVRGCFCELVGDVNLRAYDTSSETFEVNLRTFWWRSWMDSLDVGSHKMESCRVIEEAYTYFSNMFVA